MIAKSYMFLGEGPRGDMWNIFSTLLIFTTLVLLSQRFYKKTGDDFFNFIAFGFVAFIIQKLILFFAISSMHVWKTFTTDQMEPWFPPMEHYFETVAIIMLSFSVCYISMLFQGKDVKVDFSVIKPWENQDAEVRVINYFLFIGLIASFIIYLFIANYWVDFFNSSFKLTGATTTFGQFWGDITIELIHLSILFITVVYIAFRNYSLKKSENKHIITTFVVIAFSFFILGHAFHIYNLASGEQYNEITDSVKRVSEIIGSFFFFGVISFRLSDRLEKKRAKIARTLEEVRTFTKAFHTISSEAAKSKYLDFNVTLPKITLDEDLSNLSSSVKNLIDSIKKREDNIQAGSQEQQVLNEELSAAYEELSNLYNNQEKNIKDLKMYQKEIRAEKNKLDAILASIGDGLSIQDTDYNIIFVNDFYYELFGHDIIGKKCYEVYEQNDEICDGCPLQKTFETGEVSRSLREGMGKSNQKIYVDIIASPVRDENGKIIAGIELAKDMTQRIKLEGQLKNNIDELNHANEKLMKMDKIKTNFVGMVSHELRTPLTMIKGYSELLMLEKKADLDKVTLEMVKNIHTSSERLNGIVSDILDVSRIDDSRLYLSKQKNDVHNVIEQAINDLKHYSNKRGHKITLDDPKEDGGKKIDMFYFDADRMYQVFSNLLGNAIKYTPDGGSIKVTTTIVLNSELQDIVNNDDTLKRLSANAERWVNIVIKDNGIGIDEAEQEHIFDRFYEIGSINEHTSSKSDFLGGGAGLGLSICKGIVEAHGGTVWVYSKGYDENERNGSEFHIIFPYLTELDKDDQSQNNLPFLMYDDQI